MTSFSKNGSLESFQKIINEIYGLADDRLFSLPDLVANQERFTMRSLKGIRKGDQKKLKLNLLIAFSWTMAVANRLHINIEAVVLQRFPLVCSYCGKKPCVCKKMKVASRKNPKTKGKAIPKSVFELQSMFGEIYPVSSRTLSDAGIHLAEEMGELTERVYTFLGEHKNKFFNDLKNEIADYISCLFGLASSAGIDVAKELSKMYKNNCHVCHTSPCKCNFSSISRFES